MIHQSLVWDSSAFNGDFSTMGMMNSILMAYYYAIRSLPATLGCNVLSGVRKFLHSILVKLHLIRAPWWMQHFIMGPNLVWVSSRLVRLQAFITIFRFRAWFKCIQIGLKLWNAAGWHWDWFGSPLGIAHNQKSFINFNVCGVYFNKNVLSYANSKPGYFHTLFLAHDYLWYKVRKK